MAIAESEAPSITIENLGPIPRLTLPILPEGGVVLALGPNGSGKTHALKGVQATYDATVRPGLSHTDGTPSGKIEAPGLVIRLGKVNTKRGELEVESIDSDCDPSKLVDPGIKDPSAADAARLKIIARRRRVKVDRERWADLLTDAFRVSLADDLPEELDAVGQAAFIKKRLNDDALTLEKDGKAKESKASGMREAVKDVPREAPKFEQTFAEASEAVAEAKRKRAAKLVAEVSAETAKKRLAELGDEGPGVVAMQQAVALRREDRTAAFERLARAKAELVNAEVAFKDAEVAFDRASDGLNDAIKREELRAESLAAVESLIPDAPSDEELAELEGKKLAAEGAEVMARRVVDANAQRASADAIYEEARQALNAAEDLRTLAKKTDDVLAEALANAGIEGISVHDGRLCVATDRGPRELFADLSQGEKWKVAIEQAAAGFDAAEAEARAAGKEPSVLRLLPVQQEAWEGLDPKNRRLVDELAKRHRVTIYSAQAADGELRAEAYAG